MNLPFTVEQFFEVFAAYNMAVWPAQFVLGILAVALLVIPFHSPEAAGRVVSFGLAFLWAWLGIAYHLAFFWAVNPLAPLFATISLAAGVAFLWVGGIRGRLVFEQGMSIRIAAGLGIAVFALTIYPLIGKLIGHRYPFAPTFGLPCPTTIFTFGVLLMASVNLPKVLIIGPLLWAIIGAFAAFSLGVTQDLSLIPVAVLGVYMLVRNKQFANTEKQTDT